MNYHSALYFPTKHFEGKGVVIKICGMHSQESKPQVTSIYNHCSRSFMPPDNSRYRLTHCPRGWSLVISPQLPVANYGSPMLKHSEFSSDLWNISKEHRIHSPGLELSRLLETDIPHLTVLHASAQKVHCFVSRAVLSRERLDSTLLPIRNSLLREASMNSSRGMLMNTASW